MLHAQIVIEKMRDFADESGEWTSSNRDKYKAWLIKYLRRHADARIELMNVPKSVNNRVPVLETFSEKFCRRLGPNLKIR